MNEVDFLFQKLRIKKTDNPNDFYCFGCAGDARSSARWNAGVCTKCKKQGYIAHKSHFINPPK